jgi:hydroxymethylglutaryl-CoA lyase
MPQLARALYPKKVKLVEVSPRDGLQNERAFVDTTAKVELINRLTNSQMPVIECTSFMAPHLVPLLADARLIGRQIIRKPTTKYLVSMCRVMP